MTAATSPAPAPRVVLIDLSSLYWAAIRVVPATQPMSEASNIVRSALRRCYDLTKGDLVAICCDEGRSFRKDMLPEYKAQRPEKDAAEIGELTRLKEILVKDGYLLWGAKGFEADDVIATATEAAVALGHEVRICTSDKDLLALLSLPGVRVLRTHDWREWGVPEAVERFGVQPSQIADWLALAGDTSDNIPHVKGIGAGTATELLTKFGNLDALFVTIEKDPKLVGSTKGGKEIASFVKALDEGEAAVRLARKLVALRTDAPFDFREIYQRRDPQPLVAVTENPEDEEADMDSDDIPISRGPGAARPQLQIQIETPAGTKPFADPHPNTPPPAQATPPAPPSQPAPAAAPAPVAPQAAAASAAAPIIAEPIIQTGDDLLAGLLAKKGYVPVDYDRALEPKNPEGAVKLAQHLFNSRVYSKFPTWESVLATILRGRTMGISAVASLDVFHIVEGRPYPLAWLLIALAEKDPNCEYIYCVESSASSATWETKNRRIPKPKRLTWTAEEARAAGMFEKPNNAWNKRPRQMLVKSTGSMLAREEYRIATLGLYSAEEMGVDGE